MRSIVFAVFVLPVALTGCPQLLSDWTVAPGGTEDISPETSSPSPEAGRDADEGRDAAESGAMPKEASADSGAADAMLEDACTPATHNNQEGQTWTDCVPLGTYNEAQAMKACAAFAASVVPLVISCTDSSCGSGAETVEAIGTGLTVFWAYAGPSAGYMAAGGCPTGSDPMWD